MGREHDDPPGGAEAEPGGDSAGVYYLSIEEFEARLPRPSPDADPAEDS